MKTTSQERQEKLRARRKIEGWKRIDLWVKPEGIAPKEARNSLINSLKELESADNNLSADTKLALIQAKLWDLINAMDWE